MSALLGGIAAASVEGLNSQSSTIESTVDDAAGKLGDELGIDSESWMQFESRLG